MLKKFRIIVKVNLIDTINWFFRRYAFRIQGILFRAIIKARGYNNSRNFNESGENFFISTILAPSNPQICFDIGANKGDYSKELLTKTHAKVYAFEPLVQDFADLMERFEDFGDRFIGINKGLGSSEGIDLIYFNRMKTAHASYISEMNTIPYIENENIQEVNTTTLDQFVQYYSIEKIDLIKIDVEGFEKEVFQGAMKTINNLKPTYIQIEMNWHQLFRGTSLLYFAELLPEYRVFQLIPNGWVERDSIDPLSNLYMFSNFVFVLRSSS
jgi:FkbM family methyltransferase